MNKNKSTIPHNDLIHEVEESLKQERLAALWKEYGPYIIAGCVLAVLMTAAVTGWRSWNARVNQAQTAMIVAATDSEDVPAALGVVVGELRPGQRGIARLTAAGILAQEGKTEDARTAYEDAAVDKGLPAVWRDLATVMAVRLAPAEASPVALLARLSPIMDDRDNPWRGHAALEAAVIAMHKMHDPAAARGYLAAVTEAEGLPPSLTGRAAALDHLYSLAADETTQETADDKQSHP
ncbi:MAG: hypothetical protein KDJ15_01610 [Alphaproteobacteria bacterium]|nr:hypothetical protein [Alphaproteobacteria bacterium]